MLRQELQNLDVLEVRNNLKSDQRASSDSQNDEWMPAEWKLVKFEDVCSLRKETVQPAAIYNEKYVGLEHIDQGTSNLSRWGLSSEVTSSKSKFYKDDILYGKLRPYLDKAVLAEFDGICSTDIIVLKSSNQLTSAFLSYVVHSRQFLDFAVQSMNGVNHPRTSWSSLAKYQLSLPPLPEQRAIARVLQTLQKAIQTRRDELELERERKAALMEYLFTHGTRGETTKQTEVGEIPESWEIVRLGNLCANNLGIIQTGPFGSQLHASDYRDQGIPVINPTHLGINTIVEDSFPLIDEEDAERLSKHYLKESDVLVSRRGDFSRYSYITSRQAGWLCGTGCLLIRLNNPKVDNQFFAISIGTEDIQNYLAYASTGSIMPNLNTKILESLPLALPPSLDEQHQIVALWSACISKINALEQELLLLEELFNALLEELMTGRLSTLPLIEEGESHE